MIAAALKRLEGAEQLAQQHDAEAMAAAEAAARGLADLRTALQAVPADLCGPLLDMLEDVGERLDEANRASARSVEAWRAVAVGQVPPCCLPGHLCKADLLAECFRLLHPQPLPFTPYKGPRALHVAGRRLQAEVRNGRLLVRDADSGALLAASVNGLHKRVDHRFTEELAAESGAASV